MKKKYIGFFCPVFFSAVLCLPPLFAQSEALKAASAPVLVGNQSASADSEMKPADGQNTISLDFKEADINTVLRVMSLKSNINIVAGPEVKGVVTIRLENVPWEKALEIVLRTYDYVYERDGNIIRVTTRDKMALEPVVTQTYLLSYSKAAEVKDAIKDMLTERGKVKTADRTNALVITDIPTNLYRINGIVKALDQMTPQAYIDSKVVKTDVGSVENLGIDWQTGGANNNIMSLSGASRPTTFPFPTGVNNTGINRVFPPPLEQFLPVNGTTGSSPDARDFPIASNAAPTTAYTFGTLDFSKLSTVLQMLKVRTNTKMVSNPRIVVLNNQTAKVQVGDQIPIPTFERNTQTGNMEVSGFTFRDIGVVLNVTPHINADEEILVELKPEVSSRGADVSFGTTFTAPSFTVTAANTQVLIRSGQTIAIGGLLTDGDDMTESRVPYLSDIPVVGKLFRAKRQTAGSGNKKIETLFFVTVTKVDTEGQPLKGTQVQTGNVQAGNTQAGNAQAGNQDKDASGKPGQPDEKKVETTNKDAALPKSAEPEKTNSASGKPAGGPEV